MGEHWTHCDINKHVINCNKLATRVSPSVIPEQHINDPVPYISISNRFVDCSCFKKVSFQQCTHTKQVWLSKRLTRLLGVCELVMGHSQPNQFEWTNLYQEPTELIILYRSSRSFSDSTPPRPTSRWLTVSSLTVSGEEGRGLVSGRTIIQFNISEMVNARRLCTFFVMPD